MTADSNLCKLACMKKNKGTNGHKVGLRSGLTVLILWPPAWTLCNTDVLKSVVCTAAAPDCMHEGFFFATPFHGLALNMTSCNLHIKSLDALTDYLP